MCVCMHVYCSFKYVAAHVTLRPQLRSLTTSGAHDPSALHGSCPSPGTAVGGGVIDSRYAHVASGFVKDLWANPSGSPKVK